MDSTILLKERDETLCPGVAIVVKRTSNARGTNEVKSTKIKTEADVEDWAYNASEKGKIQ